MNNVPTIDQYQTSLEFFEKLRDSRMVMEINNEMGRAYLEISHYQKAINCYLKALVIAKEQKLISYLGSIHNGLGISYCNIGKYHESIDNHCKHLEIAEELNDKDEVKTAHRNLVYLYCSIGEYKKAIDCHHKRLEIAEELGDKTEIAEANLGMGNVYYSMSQYQDALDCYSKYLDFVEKLGNKRGLGKAYICMGNTYNGLWQYEKALEYFRKYLEISEEVGDKGDLYKAYGGMGNAYQVMGDYRSAIEFHQKSLVIAKQLGNKAGKGEAYGCLGIDYTEIGEQQKAIECQRKALKIAEKVGMRAHQEAAHGNLGDLHYSIGQYQKAIECQSKSLEIAEDIGHKNGMEKAWAGLGSIYLTIGQYQQAVNCYRKQLAFAEEAGERRRITLACAHLGIAYDNIGQYQNAIEQHMKALKISKELNDLEGIGRACANLGHPFGKVGKHKKAFECYSKFLEISEKVGNKASIATAYGNMGTMYSLNGQYHTAIECFRKHLEITEEIEDREGMALVGSHLGYALRMIGEHQEATALVRKSLGIAEEIGYIDGVAESQVQLAFCYRKSNSSLASSFFAKSILSSHSIRRSVIHEDGFNTSLSNTFAHVHKWLLESLLNLKQVKAALLVSDHGKSRALHDLTKRIGVDVVPSSSPEDISISQLRAISEDPSSATTEALLDDALSNVIRLMQDGSIISYSFDNQDGLHAWVMSKEGVFHKQWKTSNGMLSQVHLEIMINELRKGLVRKMPENVDLYPEMHILDGQEHNCVKNTTVEHSDAFREEAQANTFVRDLEEIIRHMPLGGRSKEMFKPDANFANIKCVIQRYGLFYSLENDGEGDRRNEQKLCECYSLDVPRFSLGSTQRSGSGDGMKPAEDYTAVDLYLEKLYSILVSPIEGDLMGSKVLIVPEGPLLSVPFSALLGAEKTRFCDLYSLQFIPALHVLNASLSKPLQKLGPGLFVGNPSVGEVKFGAQKVKVPALPNATVEAKACSKYFNSEPLLEEKATKENVLNRMKDASIVHIAAHGHMVHADIFLAPSQGAPTPPTEEHYLLIADDVLQCSLTARLVVLSCCHSGRGQISPEGVVGVARSFLGAGARSVLVALWQILDEETMEFMKLFYANVCEGHSVCLALQKSMQELKKKCQVAAWAPFQIVGEDVSLTIQDIEEIRRQSLLNEFLRPKDIE